MALRVAARTAYVALRNLCVDCVPRCSRAPEVESLHGAGTVIEVESPFGGSAVHTAVLALVGIQPVAALLHVAGDVALVALSVVSVALGFALLVSLPRLWRIVGFAAGHAPILVDYWGDESLGTAELPGEAA